MLSESLLNKTMGQSIVSTPHNPVDHPSHYTQGDIECIDALESALGPEGFKGYCKGCAMKYLWRTDYKGELEDLQKAVWYINRIISTELKRSASA